MDVLDRSELAQNVGANDLAESFMAFNTNYRDSGLFGIYAVAKVCGPF
jgi:processing peptidase subunit beta